MYVGSEKLHELFLNKTEKTTATKDKTVASDTRDPKRRAKTVRGKSAEQQARAVKNAAGARAATERRTSWRKVEMARLQQEKTRG